MKRFVILEHDHPVLHWDLMLEAGDVLQTWRLARPPEVGVVIDATALGDHRLAYLDYEGPVSGGRGSVKRWDSGEFIELKLADVRCLVMHGERMRGKAWLTKSNEAEWSFVWFEDESSLPV